MPNQFFRTTVSIDVLSEEPISDLDLPSILYGITEGDLVGGPIKQEQVVLSGKEVADAMRKFGSEPGFFQLDDDGKSLEDHS